MVRHLLADDLTGAADAAVAFAAHGEVVIRLPGAPAAAADLVAVDTESRGMAPAEAARAVAEACRNLDGRVFKKVDSTLRGAVGAELEAVRAALGLRSVLLAPSLPAQGRTVVGGRLLVAGRDLGSVAELADVPPGWVADAALDSDLDRLAARWAADPGLLAAGSAGLAQAIARRLGPARAAPPLPRLAEVLVGVASRNPVSRAQAAAVRAAAPAGVTLVEGTAEEVGAAAAGRPGAAVVATGGDAALAACRARGALLLRPRRELLPGLVLSELDGGRGWLASKAGGFGAPDALLRAALKLLGVEAGG